jgi:hypothetical protein
MNSMRLSVVIAVALAASADAAAFARRQGGDLDGTFLSIAPVDLKYRHLD